MTTTYCASEQENGREILAHLSYVYTTMRAILFEPDIPQNVGTMLRLAACFGVPVDLIEPCGFPFDDRRLKRSGMDYLDQVELARHRSWAAYRDASPPGRLILLTTKGETRYTDFSFQPTDRLMVGRETSGVPDEVAALADARLRVPMRAGLRSINVALALAVVLGEALRQTGELPT